MSYLVMFLVLHFGKLKYTSKSKHSPNRIGEVVVEELKPRQLVAAVSEVLSHRRKDIDGTNFLLCCVV